MVPHCDVVTINAPLHPETEGLFDDKLLGTMKRGAYLINTARAKIADRDAIVRALESGQLAGYAGDVWYPAARAGRPPLADHAAPRHDAAHLRLLAVRPGPLRRRHPRDPGVLAAPARRSARSTSSSTAGDWPAPARTRYSTTRVSGDHAVRNPDHVRRGHNQSSTAG